MQMLLNQIKGKEVVFTGHSLGGAIAALAALHYLCISSSSQASAPVPPVLCVTFGSPLLGNEALSRAILRERWGGSFCHVVSQHDVVPRLLFCPLDAVPVRIIVGMQLQQRLGCTRHACAVSVRVTESEQEALRQLVQAHIRSVAMEQKLAAPETRGGSPYRPFGTYVLCSLDGAACVDSLTAAVQMLYATFAARCVPGSVTSLEAAHSCYGDLVLKMPQQLLFKRRPNTIDAPVMVFNSNYDAGISLALEASGIHREATEGTTARHWLKASKRAGRSPSLNCAGLAMRLGKITPSRAQIEWYKASFDADMGYYDAFKLQRSTKKFHHANMCRHKLAQFWDGVLSMLDNSQLPYS
jgi:pimeloyl-ACP methyl ester carboxylesterase